MGTVDEYVHWEPADNANFIFVNILYICSNFLLQFFYYSRKNVLMYMTISYDQFSQLFINKLQMFCVENC